MRMWHIVAKVLISIANIMLLIFLAKLFYESQKKKREWHVATLFHLRLFSKN